MSDTERNLLLSIKMSSTEVEKTLKNTKLTARYAKAIEAAGYTSTGCEQPQGALIQKLCQKDNPSLELIAKYIGNGKIASGEQLDAAVQFTAKAKNFTEEEFEAAAGVGIVITPEQIQQGVASAITESMPQINEKGKKAALGIVLKAVKANPTMKFAPSSKVTEEVKKQIADLP